MFKKLNETTITCIELGSMQNYGDLFYLPFHINSARLSALLDSGASKSFISSHIVPTLSEYLVPIDVDTLQVSLPNGQKIVSKAA